MENSTEQNNESSKHGVAHTLRELGNKLYEKADEYEQETLVDAAKEAFVGKPVAEALATAGERLATSAPTLEALHGPVAGSLARHAGDLASTVSEAMTAKMEFAKTAGEYLLERAPVVSASQGPVAEALYKGVGHLAVRSAESSEAIGKALNVVTEQVIGKGAGEAALLYGVGKASYEITTAIDEHTNHSITNSQPAKLMGQAQERSGADERLWYAQQALDSYNHGHPGTTMLDKAGAAVAWTQAMLDSHMTENHVESLQHQINNTLSQAGRHDAHVSLAEASQMYAALAQAKAGDRILVDPQGNFSLESGAAHGKVEPGTTVFDAETLHMASMNRYEAPATRPAAVQQASMDKGLER